MTVLPPEGTITFRKDVAINELMSTLTMIDKQIKAVTADAIEQHRLANDVFDTDVVYKTRYTNGVPVILDLIEARANVVSALARLT